MLVGLFVCVFHFLLSFLLDLSLVKFYLKLKLSRELIKDNLFQENMGKRSN